jgi:hypothetical protein
MLRAEIGKKSVLFREWETIRDLHLFAAGFPPASEADPEGKGNLLLSISGAG